MFSNDTVRISEREIKRRTIKNPTTEGSVLTNHEKSIQQLEEEVEELIGNEALTEDNWGPVQELGINHIFSTGQTLLGYAVQLAREKSVIFLVTHGADVNLHRDFVPPIMDAYHIGLPRIFIYLLINGGDLNAHSGTGISLQEDIDLFGPEEFLNRFPATSPDRPRRP